MIKVLIQACLIIAVTFSLSARAEDPVPSIQTKICTPADVTVFFGSRLHIKCTTPLRTGYYSDINVYYFSVSANDYDDLDYSLKMATQAIASGKRLKLWVRSQSSYNPSGCGSSNCRKITGISLLN